MAGITFESYRNFCSNFNVGIFYTEMISDKGLIYESTETLRYLPSNQTSRPLGIQLFGSSPETIVEAIKIIERTTNAYDFIDINMGCSVPKVAKGGAGATLLKDLDLAESIIKAASKTSKKPISVKVRLGWNTNDIDEIVVRFEKAGAQLIAIHPRYATQLFQPSPHWELVRNIQSKVNIPIVVSGDIYTVEDALKALAITGAQGVMVARGGVGNPLLLENINLAIKNKKTKAYSLTQQKELAITFVNMVCTEKGDYNGTKVLRGIIPKFFQDYPNAKKHRSLVTQCDNKTELLNVINSFVN